MCNNWQRYIRQPEKIQEELTLSDLKNFFLRDKDWLSSLKHIGISGGEPFLRPDLVQMVKLIREQLPHVAVGIQTNGLLPEEVEDKLKEILHFYSEITLAVSLDGMRQTHEKIRGVPGAFEKVIKTIKVAKKLKIKEITAGMTVVKDNLSEIAEVRRLLSSEGVKFSFYPADNGEYYSNIGANNNLSVSEKSALAKELEENGGDYFHDNLRRLILGQAKRTLPCYSGWTSYVLDPYGNVKPCVLRGDILGNIKDQPLREILTSVKARKIRREIKNCSCWSICEVTTSAVVDPWDVGKWFLFYARRREFLRKLLL